MLRICPEAPDTIACASAGYRPRTSRCFATAVFLIWNDLVKSAYFVRTLHPVAQAGSSHRTAQIGEHAALVVAETRSRRLITLIFAGRHRIVMIRRELPRTKSAGRARKPA